MDDLTTPDELEMETEDVEESGDVEKEPEKATLTPKEKRLKELNTRIEKLLKSEIANSKEYIDQIKPIWQTNIEMRIGGFARVDPTLALLNDSDSSAMAETIESSVNPDWSLTKVKIANLYSQTPEVRVTHQDDAFAAAIPLFAKSLNWELGPKRAGIGDAMEEVLSDVVNATGFGVAEVGYIARFKKRIVPTSGFLPGPNGDIPVSEVSDEELQLVIADHEKMGMPFPTQVIRVPTDQRFCITRFSPEHAIVQASFKGSNFDRSSFVGRQGQCTWSEGKAEFNLLEKHKQTILQGGGREDNPLNLDTTQGESSEPLVNYQKVYYWRYKYDAAEPHLSCIWKIVFVDGIEEAVVHKPWDGQRYDEEIHDYIGSKKFPIRFLTLTYITDMTIPPSDSEAGRPQVIDMRRSRTQIFENRERSRPMRWINSSLVDPEIRDLVTQGIWQGIIPVKGDGSRIMGEVARASYPQESLSLDMVTKADLMEAWQIGANQMGVSSRSDQTAAETEVVQSNFSTRMGQERNRVARFVVDIAEVMAGWMVLYSDFTNLSPKERKTLLGAWNIKHIAQDIVLDIRPDSTVFVDTESRIKQLLRYMNYVGKSGLVNLAPVIAELTELHGLDPSKIMMPPQPHEEKPKISLALSGKDDLQNAMALAFLVESEQAPSMKSLAQAQMLLRAVNMEPNVSGLTEEVPPEGGPPQLGAGQPPKQLSDGRPNPGWQAMGRVMKRSRDAMEG